MATNSEEFKEQLRELRDLYLDGFQDKSDPRYIALIAQAAEDDVKDGRTRVAPDNQLAH